MARQSESQTRSLAFLPWLLLMVVVVTIVYNWPSGSRGGPAEEPVTVAGETTESATSTPAPREPQRLEILAELLNFRSKPEVSNDTVVATLTKGTVVKLLSSNKQWLEVELTDGRRGFIAARDKYYRKADPGN